MKETRLTYTFPFPKELMKDFFNNMKAYGEVHPLILKVEQVEATPSLSKITERPYKFLPVKISYFTSIESKEDEIIYTVTGIPLSYLKIKYNFRTIEKGETEIICLLQLDSKLIGKQIFMGKLNKAQNELMDSLLYYLKK